jgi:excisionase family DNA binding protein
MATENRPEETWRTIPEACDYTRLSRSTLYGLMETGRLAYTRIGRRRLIPLSALVALCTKNLVQHGE